MFLPITIDGKGNPNVDSSERAGALYSLAYAIKMPNYKKTAAEQEFTDLQFISKGLGSKSKQENWLKKTWFILLWLPAGLYHWRDGEKGSGADPCLSNSPMTRFVWRNDGRRVCRHAASGSLWRRTRCIGQNHQLTRISHTHREITNNWIDKPYKAENKAL